MDEKLRIKTLEFLACSDAQKQALVALRMAQTEVDGLGTQLRTHATQLLEVAGVKGETLLYMEGDGKGQKPCIVRLRPDMAGDPQAVVILPVIS